MALDALVLALRSASEANVARQEKLFWSAVASSKYLTAALTTIERSTHPDISLVAGCIPKTIWNLMTRRAEAFGIEDYDAAYSGSDAASSIHFIIDGNRVPLDVVNVANSGHPDVPSAVRTWSPTAACVGISWAHHRKVLIAPFGLSDLFSMTLRPNPASGGPDTQFFSKASRWQKKWPELRVDLGWPE